jgi:hypothetical protein
LCCRYSCSAGSMLLFLTTVLLVETAGKEPEQILLETINRAGYVLFHMTSVFRGSKCERWTSGLSYAPVGSEYIEVDGHDDDEEEDDDDNNDDDGGNHSGGGGGGKEHEGEFGTDAKNGRVATAAGAGSLVGMIGGLGFMALKSSLKSSENESNGRDVRDANNQRKESSSMRTAKQRSSTKGMLAAAERRLEDGEEEEEEEVDDDGDNSDSDEVNLDEIREPPPTRRKPLVAVDKSPPLKQEELQMRKLEEEFQGEKGLDEGTDEGMLALQLSALESEKLEAVEAEDYAKAAAISQEIKLLKEGGGVTISESSKPVVESARNLPISTTPTPIAKPNSNQLSSQTKQMSTTTKTTVHPTSSTKPITTTKTTTPAPAPPQSAGRVPISLSGKGAPPPPKPQEKIVQRKAAAAMFDSMMDDF